MRNYDDGLLDQIEPLSPLDFFALSFEIEYAKAFRRLSPLPSTTPFLGEEKFAEVSMGWNEEALLIEVSVDKPFEECFFPQLSQGDAVELFFDTRDLKSAGFLTRFCHHFVILPKEVGEIRVQELTRFRTEDTHPLCDPEEIEVKADFGRKKYTLQITIPSNCLHGYDPASFDRLGLTYRIHRFKGSPQHFSVSSRYYSIEQEAALWSSVKLKK
ncbi:MAG: hypothetical protein HYX48_03065 [Chlamydiales bacterium]|nr:hypothetical protein [Chlamydiales bacterium]